MRKILLALNLVIAFQISSVAFADVNTDRQINDSWSVTPPPPPPHRPGPPPPPPHRPNPPPPHRPPPPPPHRPPPPPPRPPRPPYPPPHRPPPPPNWGRYDVPVYVNQWFTSGSTMSLGQYVNLYNYQGYVLESLQIVARDYDRGISRVDVVVNNWNMGSIILDGRANTDIYLNERLDSYDRIDLLFAGQVLVDQVILHLVR